MKKFTKQLLTGVVALGLLAPVSTSALNSNPQIVVNAKSRALSYYRAKKDVHKAHIRINGGSSASLALHNDGKWRNKTYLMSYFGANSNIYFTVTHYGRYAHIHITVRGNYGNAQEDARHPGLHNWSNRSYRFYGIRRNKTVRAY